jgi:hypothetical protein
MGQVEGVIASEAKQSHAAGAWLAKIASSPCGLLAMTIPRENGGADLQKIASAPAARGMLQSPQP